MSELTKTNPVQITINPGPPMVKVEVDHFQSPEEDPSGHHEQVLSTPSEDDIVTNDAITCDTTIPTDHQETQEIVLPIDSSVSSDLTVTVTSEPLIRKQGQNIITTSLTSSQLKNQNVATTSGSSSSSVAAAAPVVNNQVVVTQQQQSPMQIQAPTKCQDVRVDNWGNYCLQRLQVMYDRGDFCDLTMQFQTNQLLKVHRVVVNLCTEYFANLERLFGLTGGVLVLPKDIEYQAMVTIVKFFYTGKLEIRGNQFNEVYKTVKLMNITILIKLLEAHAKKPIAPTKKEPTRPIVFKQAVEIGRPLQKGHNHQTHHLTGSSGVRFSGGTSLSIQGAGGTTKTLQVATPGAKLPPGVKTKTVLARVQSQSMRLNQQGHNKSSIQKKLPIWKERKFIPAMSESQIADKWPIKDEVARPTRFEWNDPEEDTSFLSSPVISHTLMDKQKLSSSSRKAEDIFDAVKSQNLGKRNLANSNQQEKQDQPPLKMIKIEPVIDGQNQLMDTSDPNQVNLTEETVEEVVSTSDPAPVYKKGLSILKSAIKTIPQNSRPTQMFGKNDPNLGAVGKSPEIASSSSRISSPSKTVRFAPEIEKENNVTISDAQIQIPAGSAEDFASSHSKIIAEVLKKYPDLVKDKQNIKLKIVQKGTEAQSKDKSKVSYIVLKSTSSPSSEMGAVLLKKPNHTTANRAFWDGEKDKKPSGAENTTGPWLCGPCGGGDDTPMQYESYYVYRRHLVDIHGERIDARICEYCGQKASKRNLLLYHLYTKHGIAPPKNMQFPSCDRCDYVALSESLLSKHKLTHDATKEYSCEICNASFKSSAALQSHMSANLHRNKDTKVYECPYCRKPFVRNINLKGHIRALHKDIARIEEMDDPRLPHDESLLAASRTTTLNLQNRKQRQFPSILGSRGIPVEILPGDGTEGQQVSLVTADGQTIEILHGLDPNTISVPMNLVPSSEAEAMTSVANSIAASLGLETQGVHGAAEYMTGVTTDGSQAVYIMDNSQPAVEVDMSAMGLTADGTMIYEGGDDPSGQGQFIVQDIHGNQFRKMTGIDENGKQVIFFQLSEDSTGQMTMAPGMLTDGIEMEQGDSSVYVSSGLTVPVNVSSNSSQQTQVLLTTSEQDGTVYDMIPHHNQLVIDDSALEAENQVEVAHDGQQEYHEEESHEHIEQNVQELHIVLDQNQIVEDNNDDDTNNEASLINHEEHSDQQSFVQSDDNCETIISGDSIDEDVKSTEPLNNDENTSVSIDANDVIVGEQQPDNLQEAETQQIQPEPDEQETQEFPISADQESTQVILEETEISEVVENQEEMVENVEMVDARDSQDDGHAEQMELEVAVSENDLCMVEEEVVPQTEPFQT